MAKVFCTLVAALLFVYAVNAAEPESSSKGYPIHSFSAPFTDYSLGNGQRRINSNWKSGGSATIKENFVRLTPDRPNQQGWLIDQRMVNFEDFSVQFKFRASGQGKSIFGDGFGFWFTSTDRKAFKPGKLLGHPDSFTGIGVLFDTFRNAEKGAIHKDISLVQSSGESAADMKRNRPGCFSKYRLHEGRDSFSIEQHAVAKITLVNNILEVKLDKKGNGKWQACLKQDLSKTPGFDSLAQGWMKGKKMQFMFTAETGQSSDNHDLLEFLVSPPDELESMIQAREEESSAPLLDLEPSSDLNVEQLASQVVILASALKDMKTSFGKLQHELEHKMESIEHNLMELISKVGNDEKLSENRIAQLEKKSTDAMIKKLEERVRQLDNKSFGAMETRINFLEKQLDIKLEKKTGGLSSWKMPFFLIVLAVGGFMAWNVYSVRKLSRRDKLI